jgi:homoserine dehydrogenase
LKIGLLGCGTVGSAFARLLTQDAEILKARIGEPLEIARIAVRNPIKHRHLGIPASLFTDDVDRIVDDPEIEIVVELMGGTSDALRAMRAALSKGKSVVTANKAVLSHHLAELEQVAAQSGRDLLFEAAVAGGVPLVRALRVSLIGERVSRVVGIVNGTTNFILSRMQAYQVGFDEALAQATAAGFAEADPSADLLGEDAAAKAAILASLAFGKTVTAEQVRTAGIIGVLPADFVFAKQNGWVIKLVAVAEKLDPVLDGPINVEVFPALVPANHPLASVNDSYNAVFVEGHAVGRLMFYGPGAGGLPTASAVLGDVLEAANNLRAGTRDRVMLSEGAVLARSADVKATFAVAMDVLDAPGVLAQVSEVFGRNQISIARMEQMEVDRQLARLVFLTHATTLALMERASEELSHLEVVAKLHRIYRVLALEES